MTATKNRLNRTTRRPAQRGPDFSKLGKSGKAALVKKIQALRASGPVDVLEWINEDPTLRHSFSGLEKLGREEVFTARSPHFGVVSEVRRTTTVINLHNQLVAQFNVIGANRQIRDFGRRICDALAVATVTWQARLRRCGYLECEHPYFWDTTDAGNKQYCDEACKKAAARWRQANTKPTR